jgi:ATP-dependent Clp protease ATP-binding subunit ClpC
VIEELRSSDSILFIDEVHMLVGTQARRAAALTPPTHSEEPALARGGVQCIGATTFDGTASIRSDAALARRFESRFMWKAGIEETNRITTRDQNAAYEEHHRRRITDETSGQPLHFIPPDYVPDRFMPIRRST